MKKMIAIIALMSVGLMQARFWAEASIPEKEEMMVEGVAMESCPCDEGDESCREEHRC